MARTLDRSPNASLQRIGTSTRAVTDRIVKVFDKATPSDIEAGSRWYDEAGELCSDLASKAGSREHAAAVIAHLSPRTSWTRNVEGAIELLVTGSCTGSGCIGANVDRAQTALACLTGDEAIETLNGPKTRRFALNILGDRESVTVDVWAARVAGITEQDLGKVGVYDAVEHAYRLAARRRGVDPATMQATTWVVARNGRSA